MTKQDSQFQIDQLRKNKIIYATEAAATSVTAMVIIYLLPSSSLLVGLFVVSYWLYCMIGNLFRLIKIRELESQL